MGDIFDVIADPTRRELLHVLAEKRLERQESGGEVSVGGLVDVLGLSQPTVSKHLKVLRDSGLVTVREEGQHRFYRLETSPLETVEDWLIPFLGEDATVGDDGGSTAFAAWAGSSLPKPFRKMVETIDHPTDAGNAVGRTVAEASHQVRSVFEGATHAIEGASAKVEKKVIDPLREKLTRRGDGNR
ncbi:DNA-binding transcriptional ArsR family regulator [Cryobacterium mesophilum]|uniref:ArsR family transcriptional regulator n=1 Tax=Terrimesophilobacter mesophilus TaxID=433647 RepID=A0A4R8VCE6_9MICO|nr:metalloregulator ArsR/SmtB family transcription factor [Terrimesophilobacter mesophilus]MBB5633377.1 DNA-binding transcriptional ArsR family regulator [Terrimesophilobacter mesophilus]TFB80106.1 ArsR family transcriptional regulator [Terrimesophilobacter mesophilus]